MRLEDLMSRAAKYDETLARDIKDYVHGRKYGLVYEASKPEFVRMWKKPVVRGDLVNILPPRGVMEDTKSENDPAEVVYLVIGINDSIVKLRNTETGEVVDADADDVVALARFDRPIYAGLKEVDRVERGGDKPYHVVINGENYHALQTLVYAYQGMVDCIYIDPPYNSGAKDWKYNNNYVGSEDIYRHSKWLTFMEDRLKLAKKLLNPKDSILIVTIDEKEYLRLGLLLEQLFPEARIQMVSSVINHASVARFNEFNRNNEYIFYVMIGEYELQSIDDSKTATTGSEIAWNTLRRHSPSNTRPTRPRQFYPIYINIDTHQIEKIGDPIPPEIDRFSVASRKGCATVFPVRDDGTEMLWGVVPSELRRRLAGGYVRVGKYTPDKPQPFSIQVVPSGPIQQVENGVLKINGYRDDGSVIIYHEETKKVLPKAQWDYESHDAKTYGSAILKSYYGSRFAYPKSVYATKDAVKLCVAHKRNALVIDFFAGSGTTLHAVNLLNAEDGGNRRCICVTNNEVSAEETTNLTKQGLRPGDEDWDKFGIARYVTWPRVKCAIEGVDVNGNPLKGDYGCPVEKYEEYEGEVLDPETGKKKRKKLYEKVKRPLYPELSGHKMADGFEENAVFFDLEYLEPAMIGADLAYDSIAPILWMCGGCKGEILGRHKGCVIGETYAVLFDPRFTKKFVDVVIDMPEVSTVFIVTDIAESYRSLCAELPGRRVMQLYESYLRSFEINAIG